MDQTFLSSNRYFYFILRRFRAEMSAYFLHFSLIHKSQSSVDFKNKVSYRCTPHILRGICKVKFKLTEHIVTLFLNVCQRNSRQNTILHILRDITLSVNIIVTRPHAGWNVYFILRKVLVLLNFQPIGF
jgi:hypothetical protein